MEPRDRRLLVWIAVSTTFLAAVVAAALIVGAVQLILLGVGRHHGHSGEVTVVTVSTTP